jgi:hypothetical protein
VNFPLRRLSDPNRLSVNRVQRARMSEQESVSVGPSASRSDFRDVPPIFNGEVRLLKWANTNHGGMTVNLAIEDSNGLTTHPFKGLHTSRTGDGQRFYVVVNLPESWGDNTPQNVYLGEATLVWWSDDCKDGMKMILRLAPGPDGAGLIHPFDGLVTGTRKTGELLFMATWAIADDERPTDPRKQRSKKSFAELSPTQQSQLLSRDHRFVEWLLMRLNDLIDDGEGLHEEAEVNPEEFCKKVICCYCGITSRSEFKGEDEHAKHARERWSLLLEAYEHDVRGRLGN